MAVSEQDEGGDGMLRALGLIAACSMVLVAGEARAGELKEFKSRNYILKTDIKSAREVKKIKGFLEAMHRSYRKVFKSDPVREPGPASVRVFAAEADYRAYGQKDQGSNFNSNWRGYFARSRHELVSYRGDALTDLFSILSHEGFHQFAREYMVPKEASRLPHWFEEGLAEYFRSSRVRRGALDRGPLTYHVRRVKRAQRDQWLWTLAQIWGCNPARLKDPDRFTAFYAHAYLFVRFLAETSKKSLQAIYRLKKEGKDNDEIMAEVFPKGKRERIYAAFCQYIKRLD